MRFYFFESQAERSLLNYSLACVNANGYGRETSMPPVWKGLA